MSDLLPTSWKDCRPFRWTCKIGIRLATQYMAANDLVFSPTPGRKCFHPDELNAAQLFELAFLGSRWNAAADGKNQETLEQFQDAHEGGPEYEDALFAARAAVINFILAHRFKIEERPAIAALLRKSEETLRSRLREKTMTIIGPMPTSATVPSTPASPEPTIPGSNT